MTSATIVLDIRRITKKGYPVKIRVTNKKTKYILTNFFQDGKSLKKTEQVKNRQKKLDQELDYCLENNLDFEDSRPLQGT